MGISSSFNHFLVKTLSGVLLVSLAACKTPGASSSASPAGPKMPKKPSSADQLAIMTLLAPWSGPHHGVPPFDKVRIELFEPAFAAAVAKLNAEVAAIASNKQAPTFKNTNEAFEKAGRAADRLRSLFSVMTSNMNTPAYQKLSRTIEPMLAAAHDQIYFNRPLFARIEAVYKARETSKLTAEQRRLAEKHYRAFLKRGARLDDTQKRRLGEINKALATLFTDFANRVLANENTWVLLGKKDLDGLPKPLVATYRAAAKQRKLAGYAVVNTRSAVQPFLTFSTRRELRKKVWSAFIKRGDNGDKNDTNAIITRIVKLRAERARLLGYKSHAHWRMSDTMAKDPERARQLMMRVWPAAVKRVEQEVAAMQKMARKLGAASDIAPWDYRFYMEQVRKARYDLDQNEFKQYFELNNIIAASYYMAEKLYGYTVKEITGTVPTFHPDVRVYHVTRKSDGGHVGVLYRDDFARKHKRSGAWQATYRRQNKVSGKTHPIVSNNNNFIKGAPKEPVLLSLDDATTLFHEFGHALHALSNDTTYPTLCNTPRDFVEFPSQVHENWLMTRQILDKYARHYKTGKPMPQKLIDKLEAAKTFNQGFATVEYLAAAMLDMTLHKDPSGNVDPKAFERDQLKAIGMPKEIVLRHRLPHFMHLFATDSYSAGYYSYLWSDVMAADTWAAFEATGDPWHPATAKKFIKLILASGDAIDRAEAYRAFRGRDPDVTALLKNRGLQ
jgi:peptidyl-dipeptidase Dcp